MHGDAAAGWPPTSFLGQLGDETRADALALGRLVRFADGEDVLVEGTTSRHLLLLVRGWYKVVAAMETGREALLAIRVGGDLVGELGGIDDEPRIATVRAHGQDCAARVIAKDDFMALVARRPDAAPAVTRVIADRLRVATRRQVEFATYPTAARVARVLSELAAAHGRPVPGGLLLGVALTQPDLAALVGTTEPTVHRVLAGLRADGVIETGYRQMIILDQRALAERAEV